MNSLFNKFSEVKLLGRFLTKESKNKNIINLSEEVLASIYDLSSTKNSFQYELYLTNKDKNKNSIWENLSFKINPTIDFSFFFFNEVEYFQWRTQKNIYLFELLLDKLNEKNKNKFLELLKICLCSIIDNISFKKASNQIKINNKKYIINLGKIKNLEKHVDKMLSLLEENNNKIIEKDKISKEIKDLQLTPIKIDNIINFEDSKRIFIAKGEVYNYNSNNDNLINLNKDKKAILTIYLLDRQKFDYILCTETLNAYVISIDKINDKINGQIIDQNYKYFFCWITNKCYINIVGNCLGFLFDKRDDCKKFKILLNKCNYESKNLRKKENIENEKKSVLLKNLNNNNINQDEEEYEKEDLNDMEQNNDEYDNKYYEIMDIDEEFNELELSNEKINKFSLDCMTNDQTYCITNDNKIETYTINQENNSIEKISSISVVEEYQGNNVNLSKGLLYKSESNILFLDGKNPYSLYQYDLQKEKIVKELKTENIQILDICPMRKKDQMTDNSLIYGINSKEIFIIDDRIPNKNTIVEIKKYSNKNYANKIMSTNNGQFVTGSSKGELRLYDKIANRAKNLYSFYNDPIRYIDISSDDHFILITFDKYLFLVNIMNKEGNKSGFYKALKINDRSSPIKLQIKACDISKFGLFDLNYTNAKFNINKNGENNIITSLGECVIIWNFNDIKRGNLLNYKIKKVSDLIIDNNFKVGNGNKIIITMPSRIRIQNQKKILSE